MSDGKYIVLRVADVQQYLPPEWLNTLTQLIQFVEEARARDGKSTGDRFWVLNMRDKFARPALDGYIAAASKDPELQTNPAAAAALAAAREIRTTSTLRVTPRLPD